MSSKSITSSPFLPSCVVFSGFSDGILTAARCFMSEDYWYAENGGTNHVSTPPFFHCCFVILLLDSRKFQTCVHFQGLNLAWTIYCQFLLKNCDQIWC
uniref:Uncharacterized protein n=1 Tax=Lotus japonicus TaxID=34305 RepID=I3SF92_LOTJA|nr:unknown [Lotus japonicus]